jgi:DNA-binding MarR family transcriptional regulator/N-acetylglutamate synthase-like GNAT family acetyltransferase
MDDRIAQVRAFNRFYTKQIGVLDEHWMRSEFSLTELRVMYELAYGSGLTAKKLTEELSLDPGYLSRILKGLAERGLVEKEVNASDQREMILSLGKRGHEVFDPLDRASGEAVGAMLSRMPEPSQRKLVASMLAIRELLGEEERSEPYLLRPHQVGDMGWVVSRQGALYAQEYGWDGRFEALAAEIAAEFIKNFDPKCERSWIAERKGEIVGSVFLVKKDDVTAKLRLLYVEEAARGLGIGKRLVEECVRFARQVGYRKITLWTQSNLVAARGIYEKAGFRLMGQQNHKSFGKELVAETWEKELSEP